MEKCPECGADEKQFQSGYGFAFGGGLGGYIFCSNCDCLIEKHLDPDGAAIDDEPEGTNP